MLIIIIGLCFIAYILHDSIEDYKKDLSILEDEIEPLKNKLNSSEENITLLQAELDKCKYELENFECPEIPECPKSQIYDVNRDGTINFADVKLVLDYIDQSKPIRNAIMGFNLLYDVNVDEEVDMKDAELIWENRDIEVDP